MSGRRAKDALFARLPPPWPDDLRPHIRAANAAAPDHKLIVLDDDPTGTQTVFDMPVLTTWEIETLRRELVEPDPCFYILTNTRSLPPEEARALVLGLAKNLQAAAGSRPFTLVSRSDSTLRGHFPLETDTLAEVFGPFDATLLIPYFEDGGRYTIDDVHYVADGELLVPAAETPFARDASFGFRNSHLPTYVAEKSGGRIKAGDVRSLGLTELRRGGPKAVTAWLLALPRGSHCVINVAAPGDLDVLIAGLLKAEQQGRRYCFRTAAQFPAARLGLERRPLLDASTLELTSNTTRRGASGESARDYSLPAPVVLTGEPHRKASANPEAGREQASAPLPNAGGLIMVGSYVPTTTRQLAHLLDDESVLRIELRVDQLLSARRRKVLDSVTASLTRALQSGQDVLVYTSRSLIVGDTPAGQLLIGQRISEALVELVQRLEVRPRYLMAKGGITSSDLATRAMGVKRALVLGQLSPGVPVWRLGLETKFPGLTYIVFPGNVGGPTALADAVQRLNPH